MFPAILAFLFSTTYVLLVDGVKLSLSRRGTLDPARDIRGISDTSDPFNFQTGLGFYYTTSIHINDHRFEVMLDTGSGDLWLNTTGSNMTGLLDTGIFSGLVYEDKTVAFGNMSLIDMSWGNFTVKNQIFINAPTANATRGGTKDGILGLAPRGLSSIQALLASHNASELFNTNTLLENIFALYPETPHYITFLLNRFTNGVGDGGEFTVGEVVPGFESILSAPKLSVPLNLSRWYSIIDGIVVNGEKVDGSSIGFLGLTSPEDPALPELPKGKYSALFDTGISKAILPRTVYNAIFDGIPIVTEDGSPYVPCNTKVNVSLVISDHEYPINPLDIVTPFPLNDEGLWCSVGVAAAEPDTTMGDFQFGDTIIRNLYILYHYGNQSEGGNYMQVLSVTDKEKAWAEFDTVQPQRILAFGDSSGEQSMDTSGVLDLFSVTSSPTGSVPSPTNTQSPSTTLVPFTFHSSNAVGTMSPTTALSPGSPSATGAGSKEVAAAGALFHTDSDNTSDVNVLMRNSYVIIGMLVVSILLLLGVLLLAFFRKFAPRAGGTKYQEIVPPVNEAESLTNGPMGRYSD